MTNNIDVWELLREVRDELNVLASYTEDSSFEWPNLGLKVRAKAQRTMRDRIDATLAEHEDEERVEWELMDIDYPMHHAASEGAELVVFPNLFPANDSESLWHWKMGRQGDANSFEDAKAAAIAAAKGIK